MRCHAAASANGNGNSVKPDITVVSGLTPVEKFDYVAKLGTGIMMIDEAAAEAAVEQALQGDEK